MMSLYCVRRFSRSSSSSTWQSIVCNKQTPIYARSACARANSYNHHLNPRVPDTCPDCNTTTTTTHNVSSIRMPSEPDRSDTREPLAKRSLSSSTPDYWQHGEQAITTTTTTTTKNTATRLHNSNGQWTTFYYGFQPKTVRNQKQPVIWNLRR